MKREDHAAGDERRRADRLADAMPRVLIAEGRAADLATDWVRRAQRASAEGLPDLPRYALNGKLRDALFEARRSRRLVRGLEGALQSLESDERGLARTAATRLGPDQRRISRLLIVSADGSRRFYEQVGRLRERFGARLEVLLLECDESQLGSAAFGAGRRARALLLVHKDAVAELLLRLEVGSDRDAALSAESTDD